MLCWRRLDVPGLEVLRLARGPDGVRAESCVIGVGERGPFQLDHAWDLTPGWSARRLDITRRDSDGQRNLTLERHGAHWRVDGKPRPDLDGADEPDLSLTPFCNTLIIRRVPESAGAQLTVDTAYVNGDDLTVTRSRQRYDRQGPGRLRYIDLGVAAGFEADLKVDAEGLIEHYEHLFERVISADGAPL